MKTIALWLSGLTALFLFSCTKDVNESTALADYSTSSRFNPSNTKPSPELTAEFSSNPVSAGDDVYLNINTTATCGMIQIFRAIDVNDEFTSLENADDWVKVGSNIDVNGSTISIPVPTSEVGTWGYEVRFIASGGQGGNCPYDKMEIPLDLIVMPACAGLSLAGELTNSIDKGNNTYEFTVVYTVEACNDTYTDTKLQGGLTAHVGAPIITSSNNSDIETRLTNHNFIITYTKDQVSGNNTYTVVFTKTVTGAPGTNELTGNWSFSAKDANGNPVRVECDRIYF